MPTNFARSVQFSQPFKSMVYRQAVKLRDASFTFLAGWAQIAHQVL
jgi:hypothetical protein